MHEAIACYEHVALLQAESPEAHANLASAYKDAARQDTAIASYQRALQLRPDFPEAFANLVHSMQCVCDWTERPQLFARLENEVNSLASPKCESHDGMGSLVYLQAATIQGSFGARSEEDCKSYRLVKERYIC